MPCNTEAPYLQQNIWEKFRTRNVQVMAIAREQTLEEATKFAEKFKWRFPVLVDPQRKFYALFTPQYIPWNVIVDPNGVIQYSAAGFDSKKLDAVLEKLLNQRAATD
jgi:peroxiredoxin